MRLLSRTVHLPRVVPLIDSQHESAVAHMYSNWVRQLLRRLVHEDFLFEDFREGYDENLDAMLPLVRWTAGETEPNYLSICLLCKHRANAVKFFYEMLSRWLIPGKRLDFALFFSMDFKLPDWGEEIYTAAEIAFPVKTEQELKTMLHNLPMLEMEMRLGLASAYHASRILEIKGLSIDEKNSTIQEMIASLIRRRPHDFDYDLFSEMQHFLVMSRDEFKAMRECHQMSRIIYIFYLFRKALRLSVEEFPQRRHLSFKLANTRLHLPFGVKQVLSVFVGMNFLKENELFEESHLVAAFRNYVPNICSVNDSFFSSTSREDKIHTLYLEIEKKDGSTFSLEELCRLRKGLPEDLKSRVEQLIRPVFMPRNEEEVMRNMLTLSRQLKYRRDLPQVIITFDAQTDEQISFLVILARVLQEGQQPLQELLQRSLLKFQVDRVKKVGIIRNRYPKEVSVFRIFFPNAVFLRKDHSVDLYKARQKVVGELEGVFGEVRDYNGGMISKQIEAFIVLRNALGEVGRRHEFLLENFFHSIFPVELRSVLSVDVLKKCFLSFLEMMETNAESSLLMEEVGGFALFHLRDAEHEELLCQTALSLNLAPPHLVSLRLNVMSAKYLGYIFTVAEASKQEIFRQMLSI